MCNRYVYSSLAGLFVRRSDVHAFPGLTSALATDSRSITSAPSTATQRRDSESPLAISGAAPSPALPHPCGKRFFVVQ